MDIPVTVTTHAINVAVTENVIDVTITATVQTIAVTVNYGLSATQVQALLTKENITGLKTTDSPQFVDVDIPALKSDAGVGGIIPTTIYNWFKGLFPSLVDGSVKSFINGILSVINGLATRIGLLEDKYILKYVVPVDSVAIVLTTDKYGNAFNFTEGDEIELTFAIPAWANLGTNLARINIRFNNNSQSIYYNGNVIGIGEFITGGTNYKSQRVKFNVTINNGDLIGFVSNQSVTSADARIAETFNLHTIGLNASSVYSIRLASSSATAIIPAGIVFLLKKI